MKKQPIEQSASLVPVEIIQNKIYLIRGHKVMFDRDLADLYGVSTKQLTRQVRRNIERFPEDCVPRTYSERRFNLQVWCCANDESRPLAIGRQGQVANHLKLL